MLTLTVTGGPPGANALLAIGSGFGNKREFGPGCVLRIFPVAQIRPLLLNGAGVGTIQVPVTAAMTGQLRTMQVFVRDPAGGYPGTFTNALEVHVD
ncbi:MAG: hypothetical protein ACJA2W_003147 [Planctomycetota bacterium]|jgi:hypothetical protein